MACQLTSPEQVIQEWEQSVSQFSGSVMSDSLLPHGLQHARPPCPSPTPGAYSNSRSLSWWCHPTILTPIIPFSSCLQSFPASGSFSMSQFFASGCQSIGVSASASVLPMNIQDWFPLGLTGWVRARNNLKKKPNQKMSRRLKQEFLQRRHTDGQPTHEEILNITNY